MATDVFVSVGRTYTDQQEAFLTAVEKALRSAGLNPRTVGRNDFSYRAPLQLITDVLDNCRGTLVLAFERTRAESYIDKPGSPLEKRSDLVRLPTVWNQIEAAMSYAKNKPLLVVVEQGLIEEGLLEARYDWYVQQVDLTPQSLEEPEFRGVLADWVKAVEAPPGDHVGRLDVEALTVREILSSLSVAKAWGLGVALIGVLASVATMAFKLGALASQ